MFLGEVKTPREKILDAALIEFGEKGYLHASTNQIYPIAKVSKGLIFKIFGSKANLFYEVFQNSLHKMLEELEKQSFQNYKDPFEKIVSVILFKVEYTKNHPFDTNVMLEAIANPPYEIQKKIHDNIQDLTVLSMDLFFNDISMDNIDPSYSKEEVIRYLNIGVTGLQETYISKNLSLDYLDQVKGESIKFLKTILKGMEK